MQIDLKGLEAAIEAAHDAWTNGCGHEADDLGLRHAVPAAIRAYLSALSPGPVATIEQVLDAFDAETKTVPLGHENRQRGASTYSWRRAIADEIRSLAAAMIAAAPTPPKVGPDHFTGNMVGTRTEQRPTGHVEIAHDGFAGDIIGHYVTREGKRGEMVQQGGTRVVHAYGEMVQQDGTRVVHAYGERWITFTPPPAPSE